MSAIYLLALAYVFTIGTIGGLLVVHHSIENKRDRRWAAEHATEPVSDDWLDVLKATDTPMYEALKAERDMGPIFEAGYERQAKRLAAELDDESALARWLRGAS